MINLFVITFLNESKLICLHTVNGFKYSYLTLMILFDIIIRFLIVKQFEVLLTLIFLFTHS